MRLQRLSSETVLWPYSKGYASFRKVKNIFGLVILRNSLENNSICNVALFRCFDGNTFIKVFIEKCKCSLCTDLQITIIRQNTKISICTSRSYASAKESSAKAPGAVIVTIKQIIVISLKPLFFISNTLLSI